MNANSALIFIDTFSKYASSTHCSFLYSRPLLFAQRASSCIKLKTRLLNLWEFCMQSICQLLDSLRRRPYEVWSCCYQLLLRLEIKMMMILSRILLHCNKYLFSLILAGSTLLTLLWTAIVNLIVKVMRVWSLGNEHFPIAGVRRYTGTNPETAGTTSK